MILFFLVDRFLAYRGFEGLGILAQPSPNRPIAAASRQRAGGAARSACKHSHKHYFHYRISPTTYMAMTV
jgi:hypothetical protein